MKGYRQVTGARTTAAVAAAVEVLLVLHAVGQAEAACGERMSKPLHESVVRPLRAMWNALYLVFAALLSGPVTCNWQ
jgi:hypothetical protein